MPSTSTPVRRYIYGFDAPIHFLLFHAAELYLKSYFRQKGEDLEAVKRLGNFHPQICAKAATFGMNLLAEIQELFELANQSGAVIESRYLRTGPEQRIETKALLAAVEEVSAKVKVSHETTGVILAATQVLP